MEQKIIRGLKPYTPSRKDYSHFKTFGGADLSLLPLEYVLPSTILDQSRTDSEGRFECTANTACAIKETQDGTQYDVEDFFIQEGVQNGSVSNDGYELRDQMMTGVKIGWKPLNAQSPFTRVTEDSFFAIDGVYDLFDNIRMAMWLGKDEKRCASLGTKWYAEWESPTGIVPTQYQIFEGLHDVKCAGWKSIMGIEYLVIQNSYGANHGNGGFYYFPREVVNREFTAGAFVWRKSSDPSQIQRLGLFISILQNFIIIFKEAFHLQ